MINLVYFPSYSLFQYCWGMVKCRFWLHNNT